MSFLKNFAALTLQQFAVNRNILNPTNLLRPQLYPALYITRGFKDRDVLTKRCKDCYYHKDDERWYVLCRTHPRHKQRQKLPDVRSFWIVTHRTHGPRKKF